MQMDNSFKSMDNTLRLFYLHSATNHFPGRLVLSDRIHFFPAAWHGTIFQSPSP